MSMIKCSECKAEISDKAAKCQKCGVPVKKKTSLFTWIIAGLFGLMIIGFISTDKPEPTKAEESSYNHDIKLATTSSGISNADLAWHAMNTYGWDCAEVLSRGEPTPDGYFLINCKSGKTLRVYPRAGTHPKITNESGGYSDISKQSQGVTTFSYKLDTFTVQLSPTEDTQYLQTDIELKLANQQAHNKIHEHMPEIRYEMMRLLSSKNAKDIESSYGKDKLAISIKSKINSAIGESTQNGVSEVSFSSFVIQ